MNKVLTAIIILLMVFVSRVVNAAEDEPPKQYVYATYFYCDTVGEDDADAAFKRRFAPAYKQAMKDGLITGWGYLKHHTGGKWRRLAYHMGPSVSAVMTAGDKMGEAMDKAWQDEDDAFPRACRAHDDYVWQQKAGNIGAKRGTVGLSVYIKCDMSREERADEIVEKAFTPIYDAHLGEGKLTSWGWMSHVVGGSYRRLATMTAMDLDTLLEMRASILSADVPEGEEFVDICGSHSDYIWNIEMEGRK